MNWLLKPVAVLLVLLGCLYAMLRLGWQRWGEAWALAVIGLPLLWWAALFGCPA